MSKYFCTLLCAIVPLAGCLIGFDEHKLRDPGAGAAASDGGAPPVSGAGASGPDQGAPAAQCFQFSTFPAGTAIPHWVDGHGTWRTVSMGQGIALAQLDTPSFRHERFLAWYDGTSSDDMAVLATFDGSNGDDNCVVARVSDAANYYVLCVGDHNGRNNGNGPSWDLSAVVNGNETRLAGDYLGGNSATHTISLLIQGSTLTAKVDGMIQPVVTDTSLSHGAAGIATESSGPFTQSCITPM